jgi:hypothetical protein
MSNRLRLGRHCETASGKSKGPRRRAGAFLLRTTPESPALFLQGHDLRGFAGKLNYAVFFGRRHIFARKIPQAIPRATYSC